MKGGWLGGWRVDEGWMTGWMWGRQLNTQWTCPPLMRLFQGSEDGCSHHQVQYHQKEDGGDCLPFHHCGNHLQHSNWSVKPHTYRRRHEVTQNLRKAIWRQRKKHIMELKVVWTNLTLLPGSQCDWLCGEGEAGLGVVSGWFRVQ